MKSTDLKISIITPSFNHGRYIEDTILSVLNQNYKNYEHIIVDGGSTDNTVEILKRYSHLNWISEKDKGQSNAINKGFKMASGDIIAWINSDDYYYPGVFSKVADMFHSENDCHFLYGDITYVDENKKFLSNITGDTISFKKLIKNPDLVRQPSTFWSKTALAEAGPINEDLNLVMDLDFFLRILQKHQSYYMPELISCFRYYPQNKTLNNQKSQVKEIYKCLYTYTNHLSFITHCRLIKRYL